MQHLVLLLCLLAVGCSDPPTSAPVDATPSTSTTPIPPSLSPSPSPSAGSPSPSPSAGSPSPSTSAAPAGTRIIAADSNFGQILYDASGQAIYLFDAEESDRPECYDACSEAWPPVLTDGPPRATGDIRSDLLGTTRRSDGSTQVTYGGHPLYFYADEGKYQVLCHNIEGFGGTWLAVQPKGEPAET
jgi:predicted lipoprotein with Yx(FWY)xxD motif